MTRMGATQAIALPVGVRLLPVTPHADDRGRLFAFERLDPLPFTPVRAFVIRDVPPKEARGRHAGSCDEFLWMLAGACTAVVDDGKVRASARLEAEDQGMFLSAGVWIELREFSPGSVLLVLASKNHADTQRFAEPQRGVIEDHARRP